MIDRRLLLIVLLLVVYLVGGSRADPIPEPCRKDFKDTVNPVWKMLCDQLIRGIRDSAATATATGEKAPTVVVDGAQKKADSEKPSDSEPQETNSVNSSRQHKAFFVDYPALQRVYQDKVNRKKQPKKPAGSKSKSKKPESEIFFIRLPPTPYSYVPGLGYISQPPSFSTASLAGGSTAANTKPQRNPFIKLPIDFVSNGKPTAVYRWPPVSAVSGTKQKPGKPHHHQKYKPDSPIIKLNRGPYIFDGRPKSVYLMKRNPPRPNRF